LQFCNCYSCSERNHGTLASLQLFAITPLPTASATTDEIPVRVNNALLRRAHVLLLVHQIFDINGEATNRTAVLTGHEGPVWQVCMRGVCKHACTFVSIKTTQVRCVIASKRTWADGCSRTSAHQRPLYVAAATAVTCVAYAHRRERQMPPAHSHGGAKLAAATTVSRTNTPDNCTHISYMASRALPPLWQVSWAHPRFGVMLASCSYDGSVLIHTESPPGVWTVVHAHR
jgi:hypothetical protein